MSINPFDHLIQVQSNRISMAVYQQGEGFPVIFSHGFPELAYSSRHQMRALAEAGFRALAPDQRGYGGTDRPAGVEDYDIVHLVDDLIGVLDALEIERAVFSGHDWGGMVVWSAAQLYPERVAGVIGVNTPFLPRGPVAPVSMMRQMMGENFYIVHFQKPGEADAAFAEDVHRVFAALMRKIDPSAIDLSGPVRNMVEMVRGEPMMGTPIFSEAELDVYVRAFEKSGFTGPINWYRNFDRNWELSENWSGRVEQPCLMISAEHDLALPPALAEGMENYVPNLEKQLIADCGHWTQQEKPEELNRLMVSWLSRQDF